jgi:N-acetylneuraminic acid mutarotase
VACNDDDNYLTSRLELEVQAGETYYIEVADWHSAASDQMTLNLISALVPIDSRWQVATAVPTDVSTRSRHAVIADGTKLYVIAGQTSVGENSVRTPSMYVYDTATGNTVPRANMPGGSDLLGYSNTTAALVDGRIYMPAGYTGKNEGTHWVYDISANNWSKTAVADNTWEGAQPAIFSQATPYSLPAPNGAGYFLSGGMTGTFPADETSSEWAPRSELYFYSVGLNSWQQLPASMPTARFGHVAALQSISGQDHLCVAGGIDGTPGTSLDASSSTSCFNIDLGTWSDFAHLNRARYFASSAVDPQGNWYVFGGYDDSDNLVAITERYDSKTDQWLVMNPSYSVDTPRAWSRGDFVGNILWIIGGEIGSPQVPKMAQWAEFPPFGISDLLDASSYLPLVSNTIARESHYDTFQTARAIPFPGSVTDRFLTTHDIVNIYDFVVPFDQNVKISLVHLDAGNQLDIVLYKNKGEVARGPFASTGNLSIDEWLGAGRYFVAIERHQPPPGANATSAQYQLSVGPG